MTSLRIEPLDQPVKAGITIPGSKSYTNRALLLAAMTPETVKIINPLVSDDTRAMIACLQSLGIEVASQDDNFEMSGDISAVKDRAYDLDADLSGTTIRFMLALCCVIPGRQTLRGKAGLNKRPIGDLVDALRQLGAEIEYLEKDGHPPLSITSSALKSGAVKLNGRQSSQYLSALLMVAPAIDGNVAIEVQSGLISKPYVNMTIEAMRHFGVEVTEPASGAYQIAGGQTYSCSEYIVEGDVSSASYFLAIAALTGSTLTLKNLNPRSSQADMGFLKILESMGSELTNGENAITIKGGGVKPVEVDMRDCPDQAQTLAVLAAFADGVTTITGIQSLRVKETERIVALAQELKKMGIETSSTEDTLVVHGGKPRAASIDTYGDHRMAMAFAVAGSKLPGMEILDPDVVAKTFPDFWDKLGELGIGITAERTETP
jgi:3-phosphoshikimate 1-carboxyvinyltransferase